MSLTCRTCNKRLSRKEVKAAKRRLYRLCLRCVRKVTNVGLEKR